MRVTGGDEGSVAAFGTLVMTENRRPPEQWNLKDHTADMSPLLPLPHTGTLDSGHLLATESRSVRGSGRAGTWKAPHLSHFMPILPTCALHFRLRSCTQPNSSELVTVLLGLFERTSCASAMRGHWLRMKGPPQQA